jgi:hypothetical protein
MLRGGGAREKTTAKNTADTEATTESRPISSSTPIAQRKITSIYDLERAETRMFRVAQFCIAACKQTIEQLRFVLRVADTNDPKLPERAKVLCTNLSESSHEVCLLNLTWQLEFRIAGIALQHSSVKILEPLKRLIITDDSAHPSTRYVLVDDWTRVLKILDACYLASDDRKLAFIDFMQSTSTRSNAKLETLQEVAILGTLCLIVSSKPPLLDDPVNWEKDTVLASISGGTTRHEYVIPVTKDKVCVCYSCVDKSFDPTIPFGHL